MTPHLKPLLHERAFWAAAIVGLPGIAWSYSQIVSAVVSGDVVDIDAVTIALAANPVTVYLAARQYPRKAAVDAAGAAQWDREYEAERALKTANTKAKANDA